MRKRIREAINRYFHRDEKKNTRSTLHTRSLRYECLEQRSLLSILPILPAPTDLTVVSISSNQIELRWSDNSNDEDGFIIEKVDYDNDWNGVRAHLDISGFFALTFQCLV